MSTHVGSCHCGRVVIAVPGRLGEVRYCYCTTCRKLSGAAFSVVALIERSDLDVRCDPQDLAAYESSPGKHRYYCARCHSPIYVALEALPDQVRIRLGILDFEPDVRITAHMWVAEKPDWHRITDDLPQYPREFTG